QDAVLTLVNAIVADNSVEEGAGTHVTGGGGGGLFLQATATTIRHATIARNSVSTSMAGQAALLIESSVGDPNARGAGGALADSRGAAHAGFQAWQMAALPVRPGTTLQLDGGLFAGNGHDTNADGMPMPAGSITGLDTVASAASAMFASPGSPSF